MSLDYMCKLEKKKVRKSQKKKKKGVLFCPVLPVFSCESINTRSHSRQRWNAPPRPPPKAMYPRQQSQSINLNIPGDCGAGGTGGRRGRALSCGRRRTTRPPNGRPALPTSRAFAPAREYGFHFFGIFRVFLLVLSLYLDFCSFFVQGIFIFQFSWIRRNVFYSTILPFLILYFLRLFVILSFLLR